MSPCAPPVGKTEKEGPFFMGIEELQGAWVGDGPDKYWEEAEGGSEEWDESFTDEDGSVHVKTIRRDVLRARRYVIKRFEPNGKVKNAYGDSYGGSRRWT